ncbi:N-acetyl sugar amidotransferase [Microbacterium aerolatum]|uniref:N-acetyl sugar amidotransferase n=1 Tax=Microbacterium aerolatum TaxID=153731 RepID=UPI0038506D3E
MRVCTRTVMDTTDPDIWFDEDGVSSHALRFDELFAENVRRAQAGERESELSNLVERIKTAGRGREYDCVIGVSGGVDSSYLVYQAVQLGLRPLAVHFDSGWNSELAVGNIERIIKTLELDLITDVIDWREMRDLQLSFFKASVANCDIPTDHAFPAVAYRQAAKHGIKYILTGSNLATESVLPKSWGYNASDAHHVKAIQRRFGTQKLKTYPTMGLVKRYGWYGRARGITRIALLNYMPYFKDEAKKTITTELGWRDYGGKHYESVFTRYFQGYYLPSKFGFDKRKAHLSSLILSDQMSRDDALRQLRTSDYDAALRRQDEEFIAKKLGVSLDEFKAILERPKMDHLAYGNSKWAWDLALGASRKRPGLSGLIR